MPLQIGIVGLPNAGKSTLFNALIGARKAQAENYPFCTIDPNVGVVSVPDQRLTTIAGIVKPANVVPAAVEFVDIAGLVAGASRGEGLGNRFLSHIRECDAVCEVVRLFPDGAVAHVAGSVDEKRDRETIRTELILADLQTIEKRRAKYANAAKTGDCEAQKQMAAIEPVREALERGVRAAEVELKPEPDEVVRELHLLTRKPMVCVANVSEDRVGTETGTGTGTGVKTEMLTICAKIEQDLADLPPDEAREYRESLGMRASGLDRLIRAAYDALGLQTFFTAGPKECRAWTVKKGALAPEAAGVIHSDFERGFIAAEVISYEDFVSCGGEAGARERGKMRREGKEYAVRDGDVMHFRFNV